VLPVGTLSMLNTLAQLRRLESQVNLSVSRADIAGHTYESLAKRHEAAQISLETSRRLERVSSLVRTALDVRV
jgi:hypothetical protein